MVLKYRVKNINFGTAISKEGEPKCNRRGKQRRGHPISGEFSKRFKAK